MATRILTSMGLGLQILMLMGDPVALGMLEDPERYAQAMVDIVFEGINR